MFLQAWTGTLGVNVVNAPSTQTLLPWPMVLLGGGGGGGWNTYFGMGFHVVRFARVY